MYYAIICKVVKMYNMEYLINSNYKPSMKKRKWKVQRGTVIYENSSSQIDFRCIASMLRFISDLKSLHLPFKPCINFLLGKVRFADKLSITVFEGMVHSLIKDQGIKVALYGEAISTITTEGIVLSPLRYLWANPYYSIDKFLKSFRKDIDINHYRCVIGERAAEDSTLSIIMGDIRNVLAHRFIDNEYCDMLAEVLVELIGNATEHNAACCLIDTDITTQVYSKRNSEGKYVGVNTSIISFADVAFEDRLKTKLEGEKIYNDRYMKVREAYRNHAKLFNEEYSPNDFYRIAAFQDRVSGRQDDSATGGTGLTRLLKSLEELSDADDCYMVSGQRSLKSLLDYDDDGWIGFNNEQDFMNCPPDMNIFRDSPFFFPGTGYNLTFICRIGE